MIRGEDRVAWKGRFAKLLAAGLAVWLSANPPAAGEEPKSPRANDQVAVDVERLASDAMQGRGIGTAGLDRAADYIAARFGALGLDTELVQGGPFQTFLSSTRLPEEVGAMPGGCDDLDEAIAGDFAKVSTPSGRMGPVRTVEVRNVMAALEGQGPRSGEFIVIGAHYDHVGMRWSGDEPVVFNGADDNASGTAALLEAARILAGRKKKLPRSVLFVAFSAEERGLVGSFYFVKHPPIPIEQVVAMINLDMVGRMRDRTVIARSSGASDKFVRLLGRAAARNDLVLVHSRSRFGASDHVAFYTREIPVVQLTTGLHSDYHRPSDDVEYLNVAGIGSSGALAARLAVSLAKAEEPPEFDDPGLGGTVVRNLLRMMGAYAASSAEPRETDSP